MNIVFVAKRMYPPHIGGIELYVFELAEALRQEGFTCSVISEAEKSAMDRKIINADVVHFCGLDGQFSVYYLKISKKYNKATVITPFYHPIGLTVRSSSARVKPLLYLRLWLNKKKISTYLIKNCDKIIAVSSFDQKQLYKDFNVKSVVIPYGINLSKIHIKKVVDKTKLDKNINLSFVGEISSKGNGLSYIVKALNILKSRGYYCKLVAAGRDVGETNKIMKLAEKLNVRDQIQILGMVPNERALEIMANSDIFIMPSYYETFSKVVIEAMAVGVPVIASDVGAHKELIRNPKLRVAYGDAGGLADAIDNLVSDNELYNETIVYEKEFVKQFDWGGCI